MEEVVVVVEDLLDVVELVVGDVVVIVVGVFVAFVVVERVVDGFVVVPELGNVDDVEDVVATDVVPLVVAMFGVENFTCVEALCV